MAVPEEPDRNVYSHSTQLSKQRRCVQHPHEQRYATNRNKQASADNSEIRSELLLYSPIVITEIQVFV